MREVMHQPRKREEKKLTHRKDLVTHNVLRKSSFDTTKDYYYYTEVRKENA